ncbi:Maf-like protein [Halomicronema hongdechloris C2206]|uniref:Nucleoside triphosphate pyrophosphatase n=1 Tax=Halomicronema hongdechloris C2206 TaxID=1641165 RepID=A0A1Z3HK50_9CYAN|nr:nucleoside triphosphate pyrophosphatase [Halomicronema hongdechloris]ASC70636.1 Maf-like protein [Halomicronema hongdechloris C2206]
MTDAVPQFILASASKARRLLLVSAGIHPFVCPSQFDESRVQLEDPAALVSALAKGKANVVAAQFLQGLVLGCDSVLALGGQVYGKPTDRDDAIARWQQQRGNIGELYTGHALIAPSGLALVRCQVTRIHFADPSDEQIEAYVDSGEPMHCAGAFAIDGRGGLFIEKIEGCHSNVIGLSLPLLRQMLDEIGYSVTDFW